MTVRAKVGLGGGGDEEGGGEDQCREDSKSQGRTGLVRSGRGGWVLLQ